MVTQPAPCDPSRLRLLLEDRLPEEEQDALSTHLEECELCREALERMAAETRWWSDVKELATPEPVVDLGGGPIGPATEADSLGTDPITIPNGFLTPVDDSEILGKIGPYEISEIIGRGGNGLVLKALDPALRRLVAIKVLAPELATSAAARRRFAREARAAAAVTHEHVVAIHSVDTAPNGLPYLVMNYVPGKSLQERLDRSGTLDVREILRIGMQTASGLAAAHAQGLVHRDIKPANILLENGVERVKITDFGLARAADDASLSQSGVVAGTPQYMAPEQARGETVDPRADLFSLGSVMYTMATGRPPFRAESTLAVLRRVSDDPPRPIRQINPEIPEWLAEIIGRLHEKDPAKRFQSAIEVADLLGRCMAYLQSPTDQVPPYRRDGAEPPSTARRWALPVAALFLLAIGLGAAEATGVTHFVSTLRIKTSNGILVIDVAEPGVTVDIDGEQVEINGIGPHTFKLSPGPHNLLAAKGGVPIQNEPITIVQGTKRLVTVGLDRTEKAKSQEEYIKGVTRQAEAAEKAKVVARPAANPRELRDLQEQIELLKDQNKRLLARDGAKGDGGVARVRRGDGMLDPSSVTTGGFEASPVPGSSLSPASSSFTAPRVVVGTEASREGRIPVPSLAKTIDRLDAEVASVALTSDGKTLAVASGQSIHLWDLAAAEGGHRIFKGHSANVSCLALSPNSPILASGGLDHTVRLWDMNTGDEVGLLPDIDGIVLSLAFSPDGQTLAVALEGGLVQLYDPVKRSVVRSFPRQDQPVLIVRFSPDGTRLATAGGDDQVAGAGEVRLWDPASGEVKSVLTGHRYTVKALAFSPDGSRLVLGDSAPRGGRGATVHVWDVAKVQQKGTHYLPSGVQALSYSPDGAMFAATLQTGQLYLYETADNEAPTICSQVAHKGAAATALAFAPDSKSLVTAGRDGRVKLWTLAPPAAPAAARPSLPMPRPSAALHEGIGERVWAAVYSPNGRTLAVCSSIDVPEDGGIREGRGELALCDPQTAKIRTTTETAHVLRRAAFSPDSQKLATAEFDRYVSLRSAEDGRVLKTFQGPTEGTNAVAFSTDGKKLAAAGLDGIVYLWDIATGLEITRIKEHGAPVYCVAFGPDGRTLASGGSDGSVVLWDLNRGNVRITLQGHDEPIEHLAFSPDGRMLATAGWDQTVRLWRASTGYPVITFRGHGEPVLGVAFSPDGKYVVSCAGTWGDQMGPGVGEVIVWDVDRRCSLTPPLSYPKRLLGLSFSPTEEVFAAAAWDGSVRFWDLDAVCKRSAVAASPDAAPTTREATTPSK